MFIQFFNIEHSNKMILMMNLIEHCNAAKEEVLIFSIYTEVLYLMEKYIKDKHGFYRIDGKTSERERFQQICEFNDNNNQQKNIFLLPVRAGGEGINLIAGNRVILLDVSWNSSVDCKCE